ncbi:hypothetical protein BpHYR1_052191 [Brachionus plicatilis]|uniref:Uncharacterized protein n=1 Tax=Brachionus plicatilis TaxID=10195 RepID=A0A3M7S3Z2_BRAPC|nr:hypothetical protein BpHYR1_052191 [Brachionus plicatilis]
MYEYLKIVLKRYIIIAYSIFVSVLFPIAKGSTLAYISWTTTIKNGILKFRIKKIRSNSILIVTFEWHLIKFGNIKKCKICDTQMEKKKNQSYILEEFEAMERFHSLEQIIEKIFEFNS